MRVTLAVCLVGLGVLAGTAPAGAQTMQGWHISGDVLFVMTRGNDVHAGDVVTFESSSSGPATNFVSNDTQVFTPIAPSLGTKPSVLIEGGHRGMTWGYGGRVWWVTTDGSEAATTTSAASSGGVSRETFVNMFNESFFPFTDNRETSGLGPVTYASNNELKHVRIEGYAERLWISGPMGTVTMRFGLGYANVRSTRGDNLTMTGQFTGGPSTFNNDLAIGVTGETKASLIGPTFGIAGEMSAGKIQIDWLVSPAALMGSAETTLNVASNEVNRTRLTSTGATTALTTSTISRSVTDDGSAVVPVVDLQLNAGYEVMPKLVVGAGLLSSTMFNLPVAPALDAHTEQWVDQQRNVTFFGVSVFVKYGF